MRLVRPRLTPIAGKLVPGQGQLDQALPISAFRRCGPLHGGFGLVLWIVLATHETDPITSRSGQAHGNFVRMIAG